MGIASLHPSDALSFERRVASNDVALDSEALELVVIVMQRIALIAIAISIASQAGAACPTGKMTCAAWCSKYRPGATDCLSGAPASCENKPGGSAACVGDICNTNNDSCRRLQDAEVNRLRGSKAK